MNQLKRPLENVNGTVSSFLLQKEELRPTIKYIQHNYFQEVPLCTTIILLDILICTFLYGLITINNYMKVLLSCFLLKVKVP